MNWPATRRLRMPFLPVAAAFARDASHIRRQTGTPATEDDIRALITSLGDLRDVIRAADPAVKAALYQQLGLKVTYLRRHVHIHIGSETRV